MKHYILHILKPNVKFKLSYRNGKFHRIERVFGFLEQSEFEYIGRIIPLTEAELELFSKRYRGRITYTAVNNKPKSTYQEFVSVWYNFYQKQFGIEPRFNAVDGRNLKQIISYLSKIEGTEEDALVIWSAILHNWNKLDEFHQKNTDIRYINSALNKILNELKTNNNNTTDHFQSAMQSDTARSFKFK